MVVLQCSLVFYLLSVKASSFINWSKVCRYILSGMQLCGICNEQTPKYRCPVCRIRYCSLDCFKKHKSDTSCQPVKAASSVPMAPLQTCHSEAADPWMVDDLLDEDNQSDRVPLEELEKLGESKELLGLLQNPHLRNLMRTVDSSDDKAQAMKTAMQEPLFVEFANHCLQIIEPTEGEANEDHEVC